MADLVKEHVVSKASSVDWFALTDSEFIVNGEQQDAGLHKRMMEKYGVHHDYGLYYGQVPMEGKGVFLARDYSLGVN
jgi:hypothetical protein